MLVGVDEVLVVLVVVETPSISVALRVNGQRRARVKTQILI